LRTSNFSKVKRPIARAKWIASIGVLTLAFTAGCGTPTSVTNLWSAQVPATGPLRKVVVFAAGVQPTGRRTLEDALVAQLASHGVLGTQSYSMFGETVPKREEAQVSVNDAGYDGMLISTLRSHTYVPDAYPSAYWYYNEAYVYGGWPDYYSYDELVDFETTLWDARNGKLLWSAVTQTTNPSSGHDFTSSLSKTIVPAIASRGFIPPMPTKKK
jgi:hypothetical protein